MSTDHPIRTKGQVREIEGVFVPFRSDGTGQTVISTHGVLGDRRSLSPVARKLSGPIEAITILHRSLAIGVDG